MTSFYENRWPEIKRALKLVKAGESDKGREILKKFILQQDGVLSWGLYHATFWLESLEQIDSPSESFALNASQLLFEQLVPEHVTKLELGQRLRAETKYFLQIYEPYLDRTLPTNCVYLVALTIPDWGRPFKGDLRAFSEEEFVDFVWLEDGYTKWVDLRFHETDVENTYIIATVGGRVETFRDVFHHDEGHAPFRTR